MVEQERHEVPFATNAERREREDEEMQKGQKWAKPPLRMSNQTWPQQSSRISMKTTNLTSNVNTTEDRVAARMTYALTREGTCGNNSSSDIMSVLIFTSVLSILMVGCIICSTYPYDPLLKGQSQSAVAEGTHCLKVCEMAVTANESLEGCGTQDMGKSAPKSEASMMYCRNALGKPIKNRDLPRGASLLGLLRASDQLRNNDFIIGLVNLNTAEQEYWKHFSVGWATCHIFSFNRWENHCPRLNSKRTDGAESPVVSNSSIRSMATRYWGSPAIGAMILNVSFCAGDLESFHILLTAARVVSQTKSNVKAMPILVISDCCPVGNLFSRDELKEHEDELWLFHINIARLRHNLAKPVDVGACNLAP